MRFPKIESAQKRFNKFAQKVAKQRSPISTPVPEMFDVTSTAISQMGYDPERSMLFLRFNSGALYAYFNVQVAVADELAKSPSKGRYFASAINLRYDFAPVKE